MAALAMTLFIWGNSLVPGEGSSSLSLAVMEAVRAALGALGLPSAWVTNFIVRKTAHFLEYAALGVLMGQTFGPGRRTGWTAIVPAALALVLVPCVDETIQLFVEGRSGQLSDVALDCCGAACGLALRTLAARLAGPSRMARRGHDGRDSHKKTAG